MATHKSEEYREIIDALVKICHQGHGQIGPRRPEVESWEELMRSDRVPDHVIKEEFLSRMTESDRKIISWMLHDAVEGAVFETLKVLEFHEIEPFLDGYEGSPFHDFVGRLAEWNWPETE